MTLAPKGPACLFTEGSSGLTGLARGKYSVNLGWGHVCKGRWEGVGGAEDELGVALSQQLPWATGFAEPLAAWLGYSPTYMMLVAVMSQRAGGRKRRGLKGCWGSMLVSGCPAALHRSR